MEPLVETFFAATGETPVLPALPLRLTPATDLRAELKTAVRGKIGCSQAVAIALWCHQTWLATEYLRTEGRFYMAHLLWPIFQQAMFDDTGG